MLNYRYDYQALIELLGRTGGLEDFVADMFRFNILCDEHESIEDILFDDLVSAEVKRNFIREMLVIYFQERFLLFLERLVDNGDLPEYDTIRQRFLAELATERNCSFVEVLSSSPLLAAESAAIRVQMERLLGKEVFIYNSISQRVIGGFIVRCGETIVDLSIQGGLEKLRVELLYT